MPTGANSIPLFASSLSIERQPSCAVWRRLKQIRLSSATRYGAQCGVPRLREARMTKGTDLRRAAVHHVIGTGTTARLKQLYSTSRASYFRWRNQMHVTGPLAPVRKRSRVARGVPDDIFVSLLAIFLARRNSSWAESAVQLHSQP